jgi:photosystem II stability/assembly factor-like uncharacterized protein
MKKNLSILFITALIMIVLEPAAKAQWNRIYTFGAQMTDLWFVDKDNGYICGGSSGPALYNTTNGGFTWADVTGSTFTDPIYSIVFTDAATGYITTYGSGSKIYKTSNQGYSWDLKYSYIPPMRTITFASHEIGYTFPSIMEHVDVVKTNDGGETWTKVGNFTTLGQGLGVMDAFFTSIDRGFTVTNEGSIFRTVNGGASFTQCLHSWYYSFTGVHFVSPDTGFVSGYQPSDVCSSNCGILLKTVNGGNTWTTESYPWEVYDVYFTSKDTGYFASDQLYKTTDRGSTWVPQLSNISGYFGKLNFPTKDIGYSLSYAWLWKTDPDVGVGIPMTNVSSTFRVTPVPSSSTLTCSLDLPQQSNATIDLVDTFGHSVKSVFTGILESGIHSVESDISSISPGIYLCRLTTKTGTEIQKVVIAK